MNWTFDQQGPGHPVPQKIFSNINILNAHSINHGGRWWPPFLPGGKICRLPPPNEP
jgi:hypothetical protein